MAGCIQVGICKHAKNHKLAVLNQVIKKWGKSCLSRRFSVQSVITIFTLLLQEQLDQYQASGRLPFSPQCLPRGFSHSHTWAKPRASPSLSSPSSSGCSYPPSQSPLPLSPYSSARYPSHWWSCCPQRSLTCFPSSHIHPHESSSQPRPFEERPFM